MGRRQALGQHFLRDRSVAQAIVDLARLGPDDLCVEIGSGEGALTELLASRAGRLLALEVDESLIARLTARLSQLPHVELRRADARRFDFTALRPLRPVPEGRVVVVGNLPYSVAKPIMARLLDARAAISEMVLMFQREVAERIAASPGSKRYAPLSVFCQLFCDVRLALIVPAGAFRPPPQVESAVVHLRVLPSPRIRLTDQALFEQVVKAAFSHRRKSLANALAGGLHLSVNATRSGLSAAAIDPSRRAETLSLDEFARVAAWFGAQKTLVGTPRAC